MVSTASLLALKKTSVELEQEIRALENDVASNEAILKKNQTLVNDLRMKLELKKKSASDINNDIKAIKDAATAGVSDGA